MTSQLNVDTIKGKSSETSISIQGEGSATTNLQQGLSKKWLYFDGQTTTVIKDSFNCSSISDNGTGDTTTNMTSAFNSAFYSLTASGTYGSTNYPRSLSGAGNDAINTSYIRLYSGTNAGMEDLKYNMISIKGDLA